MNKYFYPIYKMKLKPWIKWWLLKKSSDSKVLSELIEGTTPITIENAYKGTTLQELVFKGQTIQDGTPSPEAPIPVQVVKEDNTITINEDNFRVDFGGKNKWNLNSSYTNDTSSAKFVLTDTNVSIPAGTYTFSWKFSEGNFGRLNYKYADGADHLTNISSSYTYTFTEEVKKVAIYLGRNTTVTNIQLEKRKCSNTLHSIYCKPYRTM